MIYVINGAIVVITYVLFRPVSLSIHIYHIYDNRHNLYDSSYFSIYTIILGNIVYFGLYFLDIAWAWKIVSVFVYHITHMGKKSEKGKKE